MSTGLTQRGNTSRPKPLQASTNIIHTKIHQNNIDNIKLSLNHNNPTHLKQQDLNEPTKRKIRQKPKQSELKANAKPPQATPKKVDENDVSSFVKNAYNPLSDIYPFDEELYEKVLKLELADDGLPKFDSDEPFDF